MILPDESSTDHKKCSNEINFDGKPSNSRCIALPCSAIGKGTHVGTGVLKTYGICALTNNELLLSTMLGYLHFHDIIALERCMIFNSILRTLWLDTLKRTTIQYVDDPAQIRWSLARLVRVRTLRLTSAIIDHECQRMKHVEPHSKDGIFGPRFALLLRFVKRLEFVEEWEFMNARKILQQAHRRHQLFDPRNHHRGRHREFHDGMMMRIDEDEQDHRNGDARLLDDGDDDDDDDDDGFDGPWDGNFDNYLDAHQPESYSCNLKEKHEIVKTLIKGAINLEEFVLSYSRVVGMEQRPGFLNKSKARAIKFAMQIEKLLPSTLKKLVFDGIRCVNDRMLIVLSKKYKTLEELGLYGCDDITLEGFKNLLKSMSRLCILNLGNCPHLENTQMISEVNNFTEITKDTDMCINCLRVVSKDVLNYHQYLLCSICFDNRICFECHSEHIRVGGRRFARRFAMCRGAVDLNENNNNDNNDNNDNNNDNDNNNNRKRGTTGRGKNREENRCKLFCCDTCTGCRCKTCNRFTCNVCIQEQRLQGCSVCGKSGCCYHFEICNTCKGSFCKTKGAPFMNDADDSSFSNQEVLLLSPVALAVEEADAIALDEKYPAPKSGCRRMIKCQKCAALNCVKCESFRIVCCQRCKKRICKACQGAGKCQLCQHFKCVDCDPVIFCSFCSLISCQSCCKAEYCEECKLHYCTSSRCMGIHEACHND